MRYIFGLLVSGLIAVIGAATLRACDVPVFRYALERWPPDRYIVYVLYDKALSGDDAAAFKMLQNAASSSGEGPNITVVTADVSAGVPKELQPLWETAKEHTPPCILLRFPEAVRLDRAIWSGALNIANVRKLLDSPIRRRISERIIAGDAAVWVLVESGNRALDNAAADSLKAALDSMKNNPLPVQIGKNLANPEKELSFAFPVVRLTRGNAAEPLLESILMRLEPDLEEYVQYPMAIPVFGRGRALYALVGKGINYRTVIETCHFMIEGCSCEVKALNPGLDLLMTVDWERGIGESWIPVEEPPPLTGLPVLSAAGSDDRAGLKPDLTAEAAHTTASGQVPGPRRVVAPGYGLRDTVLPDSAVMLPKTAAGESSRARPPAIAANDSAAASRAMRPSSPLGRNIAMAIIAVGVFALALVFRFSSAGKKK